MILKNSEKKENNKFEFTVESDAAELVEAIRKVYLRNRNSCSADAGSGFHSICHH